MTSSNLPQLRPFTRTMVALGIVISFLVVLLNMHTMVMERTREIGILKALGFSRLDVVQMLLGETLILTLMGTGLGIALTFLVQAILKQANPGLTILISPSWIFSAIALALVGAATGRCTRRSAPPATTPSWPWLTNSSHLPNCLCVYRCSRFYQKFLQRMIALRTGNW